MNAPSGNDPSKQARSRLDEACRTKDRSARLAWAITICEAVLLAGLAIGFADYWLMLPWRYRAGGAVVLTILAAIGIFRLVRFYRHPTRLKDAALDLESRRPELGCEISTAAEYLSGERKPMHEYEPELVAALETRAAQQLGSAPVSYAPRLRRMAVLLAITLIALAIVMAFTPAALTALRRISIPFSNAHYTQVEVKPGDIEIPVGKDVVVTNIFSGRKPKAPQIHWLEADSAKWQAAPLAVSSNNIYLHTFPAVKQDATYRVTGSDAVSPDFKITTYIPPEVKELTIQIDHPSYTKLRPLTQKTADISALRASMAEIRIHPSVTLANARVRFSGSSELQLARGEDGWWSGRFQITKDSDYWIELADLKGHSGMNEKPYHIKALPDKPPKVEITEPGKDSRASVTNKVLVKISASDDFGLSQMKVIYHKLGGPEHTLIVQRESEKNGEVIASGELDLSSLELAEYELVAYHAEASDNNTLDGPGIGRSPVYFIEITNEEGSQALSQGQQGQQVNLLVIQKQIIADTTALAPNAAAEKFQELAARQKDAVEFGRLYLDSVSSGGAPESAAKEMEAAVKAMETAADRLENQKRSAALPPEESALAHLYQVLKQMPELENMPTTPQAAQQQPPPDEKVQVVLKAIQQKKKDDQTNNPELEQALEKAKELARQQAGVNSALKEPAKSENSMRNETAGQSESQNQAQSQGQAQAQNQSQSQSQGQGQGQGQSQAQAQNQNSGKGQSQAQNQSKGQGKNPSLAKNENQGQGKSDSQAENQNEGEGQGKGENPSQAQAAGRGQGQGKKGDPEQQDESLPEKGSQDPDQLAKQEEQLSKEAAALAQKLERLAGKDTRLGHNAGNAAAKASGQMAAASKAVKQGRLGAAGEHGFEGELALRSVVAQLERALKNQPEPSDIASEDYPKEYETLISEYLKKLSHAE